VEDAATNTSGLARDFVNGANVTTEYTYYNDGSLSADQNKGLTTISYNRLNLPAQVNVGSGGANYLKFLYSAAGAKLSKEVYEGGSLVSWTDYPHYRKFSASVTCGFSLV
jgi:hypothetical protein